MLDTPILIATPPNSWSPSDSCIPITGLPIWTLSFFSSPLFQSQRAWVGGGKSALLSSILRSPSPGNYSATKWTCQKMLYMHRPLLHPSTMYSSFLTHHSAFLCLGQGDATEEVPPNFEELKRKQGMKGTPMSLPSLWLAA